MEPISVTQALQWLGTTYGEATAMLCIGITLAISAGFLAHKVTTYRDDRQQK